MARFLSASFRAEEGVEGGVACEDVLAGVVTKALGDNLAVAAHVLDAFFDDGDFDAVDGDLAFLAVSRSSLSVMSGVSGPVKSMSSPVRSSMIGVSSDFVCAGDVVVFACFLHANGIAIEVLVGEERGDVAEIHDGEVVLPKVFIDAGAASNDLLELGHGPDV